MPAPDFAAEIAALEQELADANLTVESDGDRVTKRSTTDILRSIQALEARRSRGQSSVSVAVYDPE